MQPGSRAAVAVSGLTLFCLQRYFGAAAGKGRQSARTTLERLNLKDITCRQAITEIAKMCASLRFKLGVGSVRGLSCPLVHAHGSRGNPGPASAGPCDHLLACVRSLMRSVAWPPVCSAEAYRLVHRICAGLRRGSSWQVFRSQGSSSLPVAACWTSAHAAEGVQLAHGP